MQRKDLIIHTRIALSVLGRDDKLPRKTEDIRALYKELNDELRAQGKLKESN